MSYTPADDSLAGHVRRQVAVGFRSPAEIAKAFSSTFDVAPATIRELATKEARKLATARKRWPAVTDCDRLDEAFHDLEDDRILARHHFACCSTCGHAEMAAEIATARGDDRRVDGYVFYDWQDADLAAGGEPLLLRYASLDGDPASTKEIGQRIEAALMAQGLDVDWSGDPTKTIATSIDWKRRHPPRPREVKPTAERAAGGWSRGMLVHSRGEVGAKAPLDALIGCGRLEAALELARAAQPDALRSHRLAAVAKAMTAQGLPGPRIDALWAEAVATIPFGRRGAVATFISKADTSRAAVVEALRARVKRENNDLNGAASEAWLLARDKAVSDEERDMLVKRLVKRVAKVPLDDIPHRVAVHAALWIDAVRRNREVESHRDVVLRAGAAVEGTYAEWLAERARAETDETPPTALSAAHAKKALADGARELAAAVDKIIANDEAWHAWVKSVKGGEPLEYSVDESWFTAEGRTRLEKAKTARPKQADTSSVTALRDILDAATAFAKRGDTPTARSLLEEYGPDLEDPPRRASGKVLGLLVALGDLDKAASFDRRFGYMIGPGVRGLLVIGLARAGRKKEGLALFDELLEKAVDRGSLTTWLVPALLELADDPAVMAGVMLDGWAKADAAMKQLVALVSA